MNKLRRRLAFLFLIFIVVAGVIFAKLVDLHYTRAEELSKQAAAQSIAEFVLPADRGRICDSSGDVLAISTKRYKILGKPSQMEDIKDTMEKLHSVVEFDLETVTSQFQSQKNAEIFIPIIDNLNKAQMNLARDVVRNFALSGIIFDEIPTRIYPFHSLSSHVVGLTNREGVGYLGIEQYYNDILAGKNGLERITVDAWQNPLPKGYHSVLPPRNGKDIYTINSPIQFFVEQTIKETQEQVKAKSISVIVTDVKDNRVLSMATVPTFNLSDPFNHELDMTDTQWSRMSDQEQTDYFYQNRWLNRPIATIYEPGSTMKTIITAIALEEGLINEGTEFYCEGYKEVSDQKLKCISYPDGHGTQKLEEAFVNSCNVAYMEISEKIGRETLYKYFDKLHLFEKSGIDLPDESEPFYVPKKNVLQVELATLGYGHAINVNMVSMLSAISAVVNDGVYYPPYIATDENGKPLNEKAGKGERVFSPETSRKVRELMEKQASYTILYNKNVRIGGKSGTTVKFDNGAYDDKLIISSYIAYAPIDNPKYCIYITIDEPDIEEGLKTMYPPVKKILSNIFRMYAINTDTTETNAVVPDLYNLSVARAREVASWYNLEVSTNPENIDEEEEELYIVDDQFPKAGANVKEGFVIIVNAIKKNSEEN